MTRTVGNAVDPSTLRAVPGELLVRFRPSASLAAQKAALAEAGAERVQAFRSVPGLTRVRVRDGRGAQRAQGLLARSTDVLYVEPNYLRRIAATPDDPSFPEQWALHNTGQAGGPPGIDIRAPEAWDLTTGGGSAVVVVLDTGVDTEHPDLVPNLWSNPLDCDADGVDDDDDGFIDDCHGVNVLDGSGDPADDEGHGTHVAGIIGAAGDDGVGVVGVNWATRIASCKWLDADGYGSDADAIACLDWVAGLKDRGVDVVATNNSWGGLFSSAALGDAIAAQMQRGILFVAASGNDGGDQDSYLMMPCASPLPNVICVGAFGPSEYLSLSTFSNAGKHTVHLAAPGEDILSTWPTRFAGYEGYAVGDGTSMAAPFVTGAIALYHAVHPGADWRAVRLRILASGDEREPFPFTAQTITNRWLNLQGLLTCDAGTGVLARLRPFVPRGVRYLWSAAGVPVELAALNVDCAGPRGDVVVGATLEGQATQEIVLHDDGVELDRVAGDGIYTAAWVPPAPGTYTLTFPNDEPVYPNEELLRVVVDPHLERGFPAAMWRLNGSYWNGPRNNVLVGDIDGEPGLEIVASGHSLGPVYAFHGDGRPVAGWPALDGAAGVGYAALAHLRDGPADQVVVNYMGPSVAAYDGAGRLLPGWPTTDYSDQEYSWFTGVPLAQDVDGDGLDEVFVAHPLNAEGQRWAETGPSGGPIATAMVDLDGRGDLAVVLRARYGLNETELRRLDGTMVPGFPVMRRGPYPAVGDVNGDGRPEIVLLSEEVSIVSLEGALERTIPLSGEIWYGAAPALADLDGDGVLDIAVQTNDTLEVFHGDGTALPGFPLTWAASQPSPFSTRAPVIGDVNGDGEPELVATSQPGIQLTFGFLHVVDRYGHELPGFPKRMEPFGAGYTPALADIDGDGRNEIVLASDDLGGEGQRPTLYAFDLGGPPHGEVVWGQLMGNAHHTGSATPIAVTPRIFHRLTIDRVANGAVSSSPWGISCGTVCTRKYPAGSSVVLTVTPAFGYEIVGWTGDCSGTATPTCTVLLDGDRHVGVELVRIRRRVTVSSSGRGSGTVSSAPEGILCGDTCSAVFDGPQSVRLIATPDEGSVLARWLGDCTGSGGCTVSTDRDRTVVAVFEPIQYEVNVYLQGGWSNSSVTSTPAGLACLQQRCSGLFDEGTVVTLAPVPGPHLKFTGWEGDCSGSSPTCVITVSATRWVTARFEGLLQYRLTVTRSGSGEGTVSSSPAWIDCGPSAPFCSGSFSEGTVVTLTASPSAGYVFAGWSGGCQGTNETCEVRMDGAQSVDARFERIQHTVTVRVLGTGHGTVWIPPGLSCRDTCSASFDEGLFAVGAVPDEGSVFEGWGGACAGTGTCWLEIYSDREVTATFTVDPGGGGGGGGGGSGGGGGGCRTGAPGSLVGLLPLLMLRRRGRGSRDPG